MKSDDRFRLLSLRLLAQLLDTVVIAQRLLQGQDQPAINAWSEPERRGLGRAMTARGPVFHSVQLRPGDSDEVSDWRVLAPTDWHFAPGGPLERDAGTVGPDMEALSVLVLGFDPCAPWTLAGGEPAHA